MRSRAGALLLSVAAGVLLGVVAVSVLNCAATPDKPYTVEHPIGEWALDWLSDGPAASKVLEVVNPLRTGVKVMVVCKTNGNDARWLVSLPPNGRLAAIIQVMNRDVRFNVCVVEDFEIEPADAGWRN